MLNRIRLLALAVVAIGGGALAAPRTAHATYIPVRPPPEYCCCDLPNSGPCVNRCCSPRGCRVTAVGCITLAA